jgi:hypothetical protein
MIGRPSRQLTRGLRLIPYGLRDAVQLSTQVRPVELADRGFQFRDPFVVRALNRRERRPTGCRYDEKSGSSVVRIVFVVRQALLDQLVGDTLDALSLESELPGDVRHRGAIAGGLEDHATGVRLARGCGYSLSSVTEEPVHLEDGMQSCVGISGQRPTLL